MSSPEMSEFSLFDISLRTKEEAESDLVEVEAEYKEKKANKEQVYEKYRVLKKVDEFDKAYVFDDKWHEIFIHDVPPPEGIGFFQFGFKFGYLPLVEAKGREQLALETLENVKEEILFLDDPLAHLDSIERKRRAEIEMLERERLEFEEQCRTGIRKCDSRYSDIQPGSNVWFVHTDRIERDIEHIEKKRQAYIKGFCKLAEERAEVRGVLEKHVALGEDAFKENLKSRLELVRKRYELEENLEKLRALRLFELIDQAIDEEIEFRLAKGTLFQVQEQGVGFFSALAAVGSLAVGAFNVISQNKLAKEQLELQEEIAEKRLHFEKLLVESQKKLIDVQSSGLEEQIEINNALARAESELRQAEIEVGKKIQEIELESQTIVGEEKIKVLKGKAASGELARQVEDELEKTPIVSGPGENLPMGKVAKGLAIGGAVLGGILIFSRIWRKPYGNRI